MKISKGQAFSGTDLSTNHKHNTGIVFPLASADNQPHFAGIIHHRGPNSTVSLAHCDYRLANGTISDANSTAITYTKGRCLAYVSCEPSVTSSAEQLLGLHAESQSYATTVNISPASDILQSVIALWDEYPLVPMTDFILPDNISRKVYVPKTGYKTPGSLPTTTKPTLQSYDDAAKSIKWLTNDQMLRMSAAQLLNSVSELVGFYYDQSPEDTVYFIPTAIHNNTQALRAEYTELRGYIEFDFDEDDLPMYLLPDSDNETVPVPVEDDELEFMTSRLLANGFTQAKLTPLTQAELTDIYLSEFSSNA